MSLLDTMANENPSSSPPALPATEAGLAAPAQRQLVPTQDEDGDFDVIPQMERKPSQTDVKIDEETPQIEETFGPAQKHKTMIVQPYSAQSMDPRAAGSKETTTHASSVTDSAGRRDTLIQIAVTDAGSAANFGASASRQIEQTILVPASRQTEQPEFISPRKQKMTKEIYNLRSELGQVEQEATYTIESQR